MNIFEQYGIREVADVTLYAIELDENDAKIDISRKNFSADCSHAITGSFICNNNITSCAKLIANIFDNKNITLGDKFIISFVLKCKGKDTSVYKVCFMDSRKRLSNYCLDTKVKRGKSSVFT